MYNEEGPRFAMCVQLLLEKSCAAGELRPLGTAEAEAALAAGIGVSREVVGGWRRGQTYPSHVEAERIADHFGVSLEALMTALPRQLAGLTREELLSRNVRVLISSFDGPQKQLAEAVGVSPGTVAHWRRRGTLRHLASETEAKLRAYFRLPSTLDLREDAVLPAHVPASVAEMRQRLEESLARMDDRDLEQFFPALLRLMER